MRWTVKFAGLSAAAAFTCVPRIVSNVPQRVAFTTYGQGVVVRQAVAWEDLNDKLIAQNAPLLLDYLSHPDDLVNQPPNFAALDPSEKLALLEQNYKNLVSNAGPSWEAFVSSTLASLNMDVYGPWYVAVLCLFLAAAQRNAGREEARQELIEKIVSGELNVEEMIQKIKDEQAALEKAEIDRQMELARREEQARLEQEAERQRLEDERLAREEAMLARRAASLQAAKDRKEKLAAMRLEALREKEEKILKAQEMKKAMEAARLLKMEEKRLELEAKRNLLQEKKRLSEEKRRLEIEQRKELMEAKRLQAMQRKAELAQTKLKAMEKTIKKQQSPTLMTVEANGYEASDDHLTLTPIFDDKTSVAKGSIPQSDAQIPVTDPAMIQQSISSELDESKTLELGKAITGAEKELQKGTKQNIVVAEVNKASELGRAINMDEKEQRENSPASSLARVLAREYGLDISMIVGTGRGGRVTADDVRRVLPPEVKSLGTKPAVENNETNFNKNDPVVETAPIDETVDYFFAQPADDLGDDEISSRSSGLFSALKEKTEKELRDYLTRRGVSIEDKSGNLLRKAELILEVLELSYASRGERVLTN